MPTFAALNKIVTGTYNVPGNYKIVYKTNYSGDNWRVLADNLSTQRIYVLDASPAVLGLGSGERVTEFMVSFWNRALEFPAGGGAGGILYRQQVADRRQSGGQPGRRRRRP